MNSHCLLVTVSSYELIKAWCHTAEPAVCSGKRALPTNNELCVWYGKDIQSDSKLLASSFLFCLSFRLFLFLAYKIELFEVNIRQQFSYYTVAERMGAITHCKPQSCLHYLQYNSQPISITVQLPSGIVNCSQHCTLPLRNLWPQNCNRTWQSLQV